jgi:hypothetical protein
MDDPPALITLGFMGSCYAVQLNGSSNSPSALFLTTKDLSLAVFLPMSFMEVPA